MKFFKILTRSADRYRRMFASAENEPITVDSTEENNHLTNQYLQIKLEVLFPKDKVDSSLQLIRDSLTDEKPELIELDILTKENDVRTVLWNLTNLFDKDGKTIVATVAQDITRRKRTEESLAVLETRYRRLFESAKEGIVILDAATGVEACRMNPDIDLVYL